MLKMSKKTCITTFEHFHWCFIKLIYLLSLYIHAQQVKKFCEFFLKIYTVYVSLNSIIDVLKEVVKLSVLYIPRLSW